jgi:uncharacterized protein
MSSSTTSALSDAAPTDGALEPEDFDALDALLDGLRAEGVEAPQWELCEGFMAALICSRSPIAPADYWPVLFETDAPLEQLFPDAAQRAQFEALWARRWTEIQTTLDADVETLDDPRAYCPQVLDVRSAIALMDPAAQADALGLDTQDSAAIAAALDELPAFAQLWALGFMVVVETWPDEWTVPAREKDIARAMEESLSTVTAMCEEDSGAKDVSAYVTDDGDDGPASMSTERLETFGEAVWAVYDLRAIGRTLGPRVAQVRRGDEPGRNDPCPCGSGKKYKKCHGAA